LHVSHAVSSAASRPAAWPARPQEQLERERALADAVDLEKKEEEFHLRQARVRASLRIAHGRSRPIDLLAANLSFFAARTEAASAPPGSDAAKAVPRFNARLEPESLTDGLSAAELAELETDVSALAQLDTEEPENAEFWENMTLICAWERAQATRREQADRAASRGLPPPPSMEHGLHASLDDDVASMFAGKPHVELLALREQIADSLASGAAAEPEYWQAVLRRCEVWLARARVRDIHSALRARALAVTGGAAELDVRAAMRWDEEEQGAAAGVGGPTAAEEEEADDSAVEEPQEGPPEAAVAASDGRFSPVRMAFVAREDGSLEVVEAEADAAQLAALRAAVRARLAPALAGAAAAAARAQGPGEGDAAFRAHAAAAGGAGPSGGAAAFTANISLSVADAAAEESKARELRAVAARAMGDDEEGAEVQFSGEVEVESQVYWWHDKYRPRKPKYFNRVHTGYEWNKYNQTHYDHDNPPPKVVQGYKFNIFYPDLIDKTKGPTYTVIPDGSAHGETCLLRFHAGPPYEDIAFRVVNKEWEYAHRRGFKCVFERGILHLYINFVRPRYRR